VRRADNLPPSCAVVTKSGSLNFLEPSGPLQACNGNPLTFPLNMVFEQSVDFLNIDEGGLFSYHWDLYCF